MPHLERDYAVKQIKLMTRLENALEKHALAILHPYNYDLPFFMTSLRHLDRITMWERLHNLGAFPKERFAPPCTFVRKEIYATKV